MVVLVLAVVWGLVLVAWLRSRAADGAFDDTVGTFRHDLRVLERTLPVTVQPANRMRSGYVAGRYGLVPPAPVQRPPTSAALRRRQSQKRRRDVLFVLTTIVGMTMLLAALTQNRDAVYATVVALVVLGGYVALLVRMRNLAAERQRKVTSIRRDAIGRPAAPLAMRRVAN
ncbi:MAG: hypothetical protein J2P57_20600 [Acidimicrobiaceae bacterium]|nr:hypothetical protein [Acidimicrobiaceae bacterium]